MTESLEPDEIYLSVINDLRPVRSGVQNSVMTADKPTVETAQTFLKEVMSFCKKRQLKPGEDEKEEDPETRQADNNAEDPFDRWDGFRRKSNKDELSC